MCPFYRRTHRELIRKHQGDGMQVDSNGVVYRLVPQEKNRIGLGAFQPKNEEPDERLMRFIEEKIDIPDTRKDDFRGEILKNANFGIYV